MAAQAKHFCMPGTSEGDHAWLHKQNIPTSEGGLHKQNIPTSEGGLHKQNIPTGEEGLHKQNIPTSEGDHAWLHKQNIPTCLGPVREIMHMFLPPF